MNFVKDFLNEAELDDLQDILDIIHGELQSNSEIESHTESDDSDSSYMSIISSDVDSDDDLSYVSSLSSSEHDYIENDSSEDNIFYGCKHYFRRCSLIAKCCNKEFSCRFCHDENYLTEMTNIHKINRFEIDQIKCNECNTLQETRQYCKNIECNICFGLYFCNICNLYDDIDREQYHCDKCGFCRLGKNYEHCDKCNNCVKDILLHRCIDIINESCPICLDKLYTSIKPYNITRCNHAIHTECFMNLLRSDYKCPVCCASLIDLEQFNRAVEEEIINTPMPEEYSNTTVNILCNDCNGKSIAKFHIIGHKCNICGSYNTKQV